MGFEPKTFWPAVQCANHYATGADHNTNFVFFVILLYRLLQQDPLKNPLPCNKHICMAKAINTTGLTLARASCWTTELVVSSRMSVCSSFSSSCPVSISDHSTSTICSAADCTHAHTGINHTHTHHTHNHKHARTHAGTCTRTQSHTQWHTHTHRVTYTVTHTHTQSHIHSHTHTHTHRVTYTVTHTHTRTHTHTHTHTMVIITANALGFTSYAMYLCKRNQDKSMFIFVLFPVTFHIVNHRAAQYYLHWRERNRQDQYSQWRWLHRRSVSACRWDRAAPVWGFWSRSPAQRVSQSQHLLAPVLSGEFKFYVFSSKITQHIYTG